MPELPEVEVVRRGLEQWASGRTVTAVVVLHPRAIRRHAPGAEDFAAQLVGRRLGSAARRGKYLWLPLETPGTSAKAAAPPAEALLGHLGMSGQLLLRPPEEPADVHLRVRITFSDGGPELRFVDQRTFGGLSVEAMAPDPSGALVPRPITHIARDVTDPAFDDETFFRALRRRRTGIKRALLDQSLVSGVGNIYADEALWRARLHYARPTETLTRREVGRVLEGARVVMADALAVGGTSFDSLYVDVNGESGYFDRSLQAYGREDEPCARCGTPIRREAFMNRSSYYCPHCQPRPRRARW
jgi:formamidopyrimidine-DNA glycosylase